MRGIHRSPVNSLHKGQWRGALIFYLICAWINGWVNNREAGDLRLHYSHYDVNVMPLQSTTLYKTCTQLEASHKLNTFPLMYQVVLQLIWQPLQWRHNRHDGVPNQHHHHCLLNRLFRRRSKKEPNLRVTGLCEGNSPVTGEFPAQRASNAENVSIWWRHHEYSNYRAHNKTGRAIAELIISY